jgi:hypothetical protein
MSYFQHFLPILLIFIHGNLHSVLLLLLLLFPLLRGPSTNKPSPPPPPKLLFLSSSPCQEHGRLEQNFVSFNLAMLTVSRFCMLYKINMEALLSVLGPESQFVHTHSLFQVLLDIGNGNTHTVRVTQTTIHCLYEQTTRTNANYNNNQKINPFRSSVVLSPSYTLVRVQTNAELCPIIFKLPHLLVYKMHINVRPKSIKSISVSLHFLM